MNLQYMPWLGILSLVNDAYIKRTLPWNAIDTIKKTRYMYS